VLILFCNVDLLSVIAQNKLIGIIERIDLALGAVIVQVAKAGIFNCGQNYQVNCICNNQHLTVPEVKMIFCILPQYAGTKIKMSH
jgi:hypothetical protein